MEAVKTRSGGGEEGGDIKARRERGRKRWKDGRNGRVKRGKGWSHKRIGGGVSGGERQKC